MRFSATRPVVFVDALILGPSGPIGTSLRIAGHQIAGVDCIPERGDTVVSLEGAVVLPGLINAHDHLELNNFPRSKWRERYSNASEWIADFQPRFSTDPSLRGAQAVPLEDRLLAGGIKNLLSGVTTVCHHNPLYRVLRRAFPIRIVRRYRYSHSLLIDGEAVKREYRKTPPNWPWIIHAAEGTDREAASELAQLDDWGCLGSNTVIVHGVGMGREQQKLLLEKGAGLIWCPSSNIFLFGSTADVSILSRAGRVALGTDSRLSGGTDILAELSIAVARGGFDSNDILRMVTVDAASILRLPDAGAIRSGVPADIVVIPRGPTEPVESLFAAERSTIRLVLVGGRPLIGDEEMSPVFDAAGVRMARVHLDSREKLMSRALVEQMKRCAINEPGLQP